MVRVGNTNLNDMNYWFKKQNRYKTMTNASTLVATGDGLLTGWIAASGTFTLKFWDSTAATTTVLINTITNPSTGVVQLLPAPGVRFDNGLFVTLATTGELTVFYKQ